MHHGQILWRCRRLLRRAVQPPDQTRHLQRTARAELAVAHRSLEYWKFLQGVIQDVLGWIGAGISRMARQVSASSNDAHGATPPAHCHRGHEPEPQGTSSGWMILLARAINGPDTPVLWPFKTMVQHLQPTIWWVEGWLQAELAK